MSVITNKQRSLLAKSIVDQQNMTIGIGKSTSWESTHSGYSDMAPPPEYPSTEVLLDPIAYKIIDKVMYAKLDANGDVNYRGSIS